MAEPEFTRGGARRPAPVVEDALLQWASGLTTKEKMVYAGWMVEAGKHDDLDAAMLKTEFQQVTIKHGNGNIVTHWAIETARLFVLTEGIQTQQEMKRTHARQGVAYAWRALESGRNQSVLKLRAMLPELLAVGYTEPLTLTVKSTMTTDVLNALMMHYAVLDAVDVFRLDDGKPKLNPPFYAVALPIGPGAETMRGSNGATKEITPPVARIPQPITRDHIRDNWLKREWVGVVEAQVDATVAWSISESRRIAAGTTEQVEAN